MKHIFSIYMVVASILAAGVLQAQAAPLTKAPGLHQAGTSSSWHPQSRRISDEPVGTVLIYKGLVLGVKGQVLIKGIDPFGKVPEVCTDKGVHAFAAVIRPTMQTDTTVMGCWKFVDDGNRIAITYDDLKGVNQLIGIPLRNFQLVDFNDAKY